MLFTAAITTRLLELVDERREDLFPDSRKKNADSIRNQTWETITEIINVEFPDGPRRTAKQVRNKFKDVKQTGKQDLQEKRKYSLGTGGGPPAPRNQLSEKVHDMFAGSPSFEGLASGMETEITVLIFCTQSLLGFVRNASDHEAFFFPSALAMERICDQKQGSNAHETRQKCFQCFAHVLSHPGASEQKLCQLAIEGLQLVLRDPLLTCDQQTGRDSMSCQMLACLEPVCSWSSQVQCQVLTVIVQLISSNDFKISQSNVFAAMQICSTTFSASEDPAVKALVATLDIMSSYLRKRVRSLLRTTFSAPSADSCLDSDVWTNTIADPALRWPCPDLLQRKRNFPSLPQSTNGF
ncbi:myb/SANT-like DNA-binding domain-containing protein [Ditylenchus destructor]|nr:myb/SANT-like DNA-binding domain-containing protein [Ditylenchus destructor]